MTRKTAREIAIQLGFAASVSGQDINTLADAFFEHEHYESLLAENGLYAEYPDERQMDYIRRLTALMIDKREEVDQYIKQYSRSWKPERISKTALAILRCALCEILFMEDVPNAAAINEAIELDKGYDEPETVAFVNGILGGFMRGEYPQTEK